MGEWPRLRGRYTQDDGRRAATCERRGFGHIRSESSASARPRPPHYSAWRSAPSAPIAMRSDCPSRLRSPSALSGPATPCWLRTTVRLAIVLAADRRRKKSGRAPRDMDGYFMMIGFVAGRDAAPQDAVSERIMLRILPVSAGAERRPQRWRRRQDRYCSRLASAASARIDLDRAIRPSNTTHSASAIDEIASITSADGSSRSRLLSLDASFDPPHSTQRARRRYCHPSVEVIEEVNQKQDQLGQRTGAATSIGSNDWLWVLQQLPQGS